MIMGFNTWYQVLNPYKQKADTTYVMSAFFIQDINTTYAMSNFIVMNTDIAYVVLIACHSRSLIYFATTRSLMNVSLSSHPSAKMFGE